jgi:pyruvate dehydrogenase E1 component alpha subunit
MYKVDMPTPQDLIDFEKAVAELFNEALIRAPVHLYGGNERELIEVFKDVDPADWVFCSWRSHYQCLLKGVPVEELMAAIIEGHSMTLSFAKYRILSSAIVGGILPIALGVAKSIKSRGGAECVHCFMGDMTSETGAAHECIKYSQRHSLPIRWIIEDNGVSTCTPTKEVWKTARLTHEGAPFPLLHRDKNVVYYRYKLGWPHSGAGKRVQF